MSDDSRNPLLLPNVREPTRIRGCPKCGAQEFTGRNSMGSITWTCGKCRNQWHGGLPQEPQDPSIPVAPLAPTDQPLVQFVRGSKGEIIEQRRRANPTQEFRKGLPIPEGDE